MSGLQRAMRHPDRRSDAHARARALTSDRFLGPLSGEDDAWLREHLDGCAPCRRMADSFATDRARVHALREELPIPPRDLGARLSRALDVEVRRAVREDSRRGRHSRLWSPSFALAGIALAAALAIVFLPLVVARMGLGNAPVALNPPGNGGPAATPMVIPAQTVSWVQRAADGSYILTSAPVDLVCPGTDASACGTLDGGAQALVTLTVQPAAVLLQHNGTSAVLVGRNALYAFSVPRDAGVTSTPLASSPIPTPGALSPTPAVTGVGATPPAATPVPTGSRSPRPTRTAPPASPSPTRTPAPTAPVAASPSPISTATAVRGCRRHVRRVRAAGPGGLAGEHPAGEPCAVGGHHDADHRGCRAGWRAAGLLDGRAVGRVLGSPGRWLRGPGHLRLARGRCEGAAAHQGPRIGVLVLGRGPDPRQRDPARGQHRRASPPVTIVEAPSPAPASPADSAGPPGFSPTPSAVATATRPAGFGSRRSHPPTAPRPPSGGAATDASSPASQTQGHPSTRARPPLQPSLAPAACRSPRSCSTRHPGPGRRSRGRPSGGRSSTRRTGSSSSGWATRRWIPRRTPGSPRAAAS